MPFFFAVVGIFDVSKALNEKDFALFAENIKTEKCTVPPSSMLMTERKTPWLVH